jgi:hypothetical protein
MTRALTPPKRRIWLWLCTEGGKWTARELAQRIGGDSQEIFRALHGMHVRNLVEQFEPDAGGRYKRYGVTGTCLVPIGLTVAEVQAC